MRKESVIEAVRQKIAEVPPGKNLRLTTRFGELAGTKRRALTRALSRLVQRRRKLKRAYTAKFSTDLIGANMVAVPIFDAERIKSFRQRVCHRL
jgi:hypothetical protein